MNTEVVDRDGRAWTVRRVWLPRRTGLAARWRRRHPSGSVDVIDGGSSFLELAGEGIAPVLIGLAILLLVVFGPGAFLALLDALLVFLLLVIGVIGRMLFRRPWTVEARSGDDRIERQAVGWRASREAIDELTRELQR